MRYQANKMKLTDITRCGVFACAALVIFVLESYIPPIIAVPSVKLGLANVVTLAAMYVLGAGQAFSILIIRIILGNIFTGQAASFLFSVSGGLMCYAATLILKPFFNGKTIWALGTVGALFHNFGQLICAYFMLGAESMAYYALVLALAACITGTFTGLCAQSFILHYNRIYRRK